MNNMLCYYGVIEDTKKVTESVKATEPFGIMLTAKMAHNTKQML